MSNLYSRAPKSDPRSKQPRDLPLDISGFRYLISRASTLRARRSMNRLRSSVEFGSYSSWLMV
ncbi:hsdS, type I site-specific deoxyribonuclease domain protein [Mycobacterium sp. MAC_011194_8550]|nr:hsdS, type I site-specific deoxyribonuclease domain protein [Mycobacterium sp. MAC_011194_8550]